MNKYIFILGQNPALSIVEIESFFTKIKSTIVLNSKSSAAMVISSTKKLNLVELQKQLGGTIKIATVINEAMTSRDHQVIISSLQNDILSLLSKQKSSADQKIKFGISLYFSDPDYRNKKNIRNDINKLGLTVKRSLANKNKKSRFVVSRDYELSSVIVQKEKLLDKGYDFILYLTKEITYLARTETVQDFQDYSARDYNRPQKDMLSGIIPVKLAQMMINISRGSDDEFLLDPFCGSGTIIQEALRLGYNKVIGSDKSDKAINNTKNNLRWFIDKYNLETKNKVIELYQSSVENLGKKIDPEKIGAVVTEPSLGRLYQSESDYLARSQQIKQIEKLYLQSFQSLYPLLFDGALIIMVWPVFWTRKNNADIYLSDQLVKEIQKLGFVQVLVSKEMSNDRDLAKNLSKRSTILFFRQQQRIKREIVMFQKK